MGTWNEYVIDRGAPPEWPYPVKFGEERQIDVDVLVIGGGIAGCWAAISAARQGVKVALLEKGNTERSGSGGPGCDHWCNAPCNPLSRVDPDEWAEHMADKPFVNAIGMQIQCRENYDTLLEMEQMGGKIRDTDDDFVGAEGRDEATKLMISPRYGRWHNSVLDPDFGTPEYNPPEKRNNVVVRVWGSTFKPALKKECLRLGVQIFDRVMGTSVLNEGGKQGARVVGATGINARTGEFLIFRAKAVVITTASAGSLWLMSMEHGAYSNMHARTTSGDGMSMAWRAGAELTCMEKCGSITTGTGIKHRWYTGAGDASYENVAIVDAKGQKLPYGTQGWADAGTQVVPPALNEEIRKGILSGKYELPFYGDFPAMKEEERRATWKLMLTEESTTKVMVQTMEEAGFDGARDQIMSYKFIEGQVPPQWRNANNGGGILTDWDLKTTVDGLYAAGTTLYCPEDHSFCAATGRYAGRKAAAYVKAAPDVEIDRAQVDREKARVLAPTTRTTGIEWKELHVALTRVMQYFASEYKTERLLKLGLEELDRVEAMANEALYALDPHKLMRSLEDLSMIDHARMVLIAALERKASSARLGHTRIDYPEMDPPEWDKYITLKQVDGKVVVGELPERFWGNMKEQYEAHNKDYTGVWTPAD